MIATLLKKKFKVGHKKKYSRLDARDYLCGTLFNKKKNRKCVEESLDWQYVFLSFKPLEVARSRTSA
jgi:hypothetical protein